MNAVVQKTDSSVTTDNLIPNKWTNKAFFLLINDPQSSFNWEEKKRNKSDFTLWLLKMHFLFIYTEDAYIIV